MIALEIRFLAGRFHATPWGRHVNEGVVEWPPSSWRLLRALVAVFHRARPEGVSEGDLRRIVDKLGEPPLFGLPAASVAHTRHFDVANDRVKFFDTFVAVDPESPVRLVWPDAELTADERRALSALLDCLNTFGRSESWCRCEMLDESAADGINCIPSVSGASRREAEPVRVLVPNPAPTLYDSLYVETSTLRKKGIIDPPGGRWVEYDRSGDALTARRAASSRTRESSRVTVVRLALDSTVLPLVADSLAFGEKVRRALCNRRQETKASPALCGKAGDGTPLQDHFHAHFLSTDEDRDGRIDHVTIYASGGFDDGDLRAVDALRTIFRRGNDPDVRIVLTGLGRRDDFVRDVKMLGAHRRWRSTTPFVLPRFASRGAGKKARPRDLPEAQLLGELRSRDLPEPISLERIEGYEAPGRPCVRWLDFQTRRKNGTTGFGTAGFEMEFATPVRGPIALGFGCHFGLGLFVPVPEEEDMPNGSM